MPWLFEHDYLAPFKRLFSQPRRTHYRLTLLLSLPICQLQETQRALRPLGWIKTPSSNHLHFTLRLPHHFESCRGKRHQRRAATLILSEHIYSFNSKRRITLRKYILCTQNSLTTPWPFLRRPIARPGLGFPVKFCACTSSVMTTTLPPWPSSPQVAPQEMPDHERNETKYLLSVITCYPFCEIFFFPLSFCAGEGTGTSTVPPAASASTPPPCSIFVLASRKNMTSLT